MASRVTNSTSSRADTETGTAKPTGSWPMRDAVLISNPHASGAITDRITRRAVRWVDNALRVLRNCGSAWASDGCNPLRPMSTLWLINRTSLTAPTRPPPGVNADTSTLTTVATSAAIAASNNLSDTVGRPTASTTRTAMAKTSDAPRGSTLAAVTVAAPSGNTGCITRENSTRKVARLTIEAA